MAEKIEKKRNELLEAYQQWSDELAKKHPELTKEPYSHPYYLHIPDDWYQRNYRILIVGEEGYGEKVCDISIEEAQAFNRDYLLSQLGKIKGDKRNSSAFWRRIRSIDALMEDKEYAITWTNLDMIHRSGKGNCRLKKEKRVALHDIKILSGEIEILEPTHVIYFGWYGISLEKELPDVFRLLYPNGLGDDSQWKDKKMVKYWVVGTWHIFTYHPGWGYRHKGYEDKVMEYLSATLTQG